MNFEEFHFIFQFLLTFVVSSASPELVILCFQLFYLGALIVNFFVFFIQLILQLVDSDLVLSSLLHLSSFFILASSHQYSFFLQLHLIVIISSLQVQFILLLPSLGICQINLLDEVFCLDLVEVDFVHVVFQLFFHPFNCSIAIGCLSFGCFVIHLSSFHLLILFLFHLFEVCYFVSLFLDEHFGILQVSFQGPFFCACRLTVIFTHVLVFSLLCHCEFVLLLDICVDYATLLVGVLAAACRFCSFDNWQTLAT